MNDLLLVPLRAIGAFFDMSWYTLRAVFQAVPAARVRGSGVVHRSRLHGPDGSRRGAVHRSGQLHDQHPAAGDRCGRPQRGGRGTGRSHQVGPIVTVLIVAGAGATAICADLAARTIREEIDAMRVLGINPIHRLVVPRVLASTVIALLLNGLVCTIGILGGFVFSVFLQGVNPGSFVSGITLLTGFGELVVSQVKAGLFGMIAGLVACFLGLNVKGGAKSVGNAVNQTVVFAFMALFVVNVVVTAVGIKLTAG